MVFSRCFLLSLMVINCVTSYDLLFTTRLLSFSLVQGSLSSSYGSLVRPSCNDEMLPWYFCTF